MTLLSQLRFFLARFRDETRGSVTVEFAMFMPVLFWAYAASYVFFDGYRQSSINLKAAYTIGDMISRETRTITPAYIDTMHEIAMLLTRDDSPMSLRITVIRWDE